MAAVTKLARCRERPPPPLNVTASVKWVVRRRGGGENEDGRASPIVENLPVSSLAPQHPARGGVIPTAVLAAPTLSGKPRGSAIPTAASVAPTPTHLSIREANTLAGGGVVPTAALTVPMP